MMELMHTKHASSKTKELLEINEFIDNHKLKDYQDILKELNDKKKSFSETIKIIENTSSLKQIQNLKEDVIAKNIKRDKIKDLKKDISLLDVKIVATEIQIKKLTTNEPDAITKKLHLKEFIENVSSHKSNNLDKFRQWEAEREERLRNLTEFQERIEEKVKEEIQLKKDELEEKRKEFHNSQLEKQRERIEKAKEEAEKVMEESKSKPDDKSSYLHEKYKMKFEKDMVKLEEDFISRLSQEKKKRKILMRSINREELHEFQQQYLDKKAEKTSKLEQTRILEMEKLLNSNSQVAFQESEFYKKIVEEEKDLKEKDQHMKDERIYKSIKTKNYAKEIKENKLPKIDDHKKKELEDRVIKLLKITKNTSHKHMKRHHPYIVKFKKHKDGNSSAKSWSIIFNLPLLKFDLLSSFSFFILISSR